MESIAAWTLVNYESAWMGGSSPRMTKEEARRALRPLDPRRLAARRGEVNVQVGRARIGEQPIDGFFKLAAFGQFPAGHHAASVEAADRERARAQLLRHRVAGIECLFTLAHVNGKAHAVRRGDRMVLVIDENQLVARLGVGETDPAGIARLVGNPTHRTMFLERPVGMSNSGANGSAGRPLMRKCCMMSSCFLENTWREMARSDTRFLMRIAL
jgi:hypothetical protein